MHLFFKLFPDFLLAVLNRDDENIMEMKTLCDQVLFLDVMVYMIVNQVQVIIMLHHCDDPGNVQKTLMQHHYNYLAEFLFDIIFS